MQILASALPGFRDLRAPLVAGYMWLLLGWLMVQPNPDRRPEDAIGGALFDLGHHVGRIWVGVALGVLAYLVGSLSLAASNRLRRGLEIPWMLLSGFNVGQEGRIQPIRGRGQELLLAANKRLSDQTLEGLLRQLDLRTEEALFQANKELDLPAILLVGDQPELFAEVDRLRGEADLRTAVSLPLISLAIFCGFEVSWWWLVVVPAAVALFAQGMARDFDARKSMSEAIRLGRAPSAGASRLEAWIEDGLPKLIQEAERLHPEGSYSTSPDLIDRLQSY